MPSRRIGAALVAPLLLALATACSDSTGPGGGARVELTTVSTRGPTYEADVDGLLQVRCEVTFRAELSGARRVRWLDGTAVMTFGANETAVVDSFQVSAADLAQGWGADTLRAGEPQTTTWSFWADTPFELAFALRYRTEAGEVGTATLPLSCRPPIPADAAAPVVTSLAVVPRPGTNGVLEPGDSVDVVVSATSSVGLWRIAAGLEGACDAGVQVAERLTRSATRTVRLALPKGCLLDTPLIVWAAALDVALASASSTVTTESLRDVTPPTVAPTFSPNSAVGVTTSLRGTTFEGEVIFLLPNAADNHEVRSIHWEVLPAGLRDSTAVAPTTQPLPQPIALPVTRAWVGDDVRVRVWARDAAGVSSAPFETAGGLRVVPSAAPSTRALTVATEVRDFVVDSPRGRVYLLEGSPRRVAVVDLASGAIVSRLDVPADAAALDLTPGGDSLVLATTAPPQSLVFLDLRGAQPLTTTLALDTAGTGYARAITAVRATSNGKVFAAYVRSTSTPALTVGVLELDLRTGAQRTRSDVQPPTTVVPPVLERSRDGRVMVLASSAGYAQRYDAAADAFGPPAPPSTFWQAPGRVPVVDPAGALAALGPYLYRADWSPAPRSASAWSWFANEGAAFAADGGSYFFSIPGPFFGRVVRASAGDGTPIESWRPSGSPGRMRVADDGTLVVLASTPECQPPGCTRVELVRLP